MMDYIARRKKEAQGMITSAMHSQFALLPISGYLKIYFAQFSKHLFFLLLFSNKNCLEQLQAKEEKQKNTSITQMTL